MSLQSFLEAGGEAVVRGVLSRMTADQREAAANGDPLAAAEIADRLHSKGYGRHNLTGGQIRDVTSAAAQSLVAADRVNQGRPIGISTAPIPAFPNEIPGNGITYIVRMRFSDEAGNITDVIVDVQSSSIMGRAEVFTEASKNLESDSLVRSDPSGGGGAGLSFQEMSVIAVYTGTVMTP